MAASAAPYGFKPVKRADGLPYAGATNEYLIDPAGEATNIFYGAPVTIGADGYLAIVTVATGFPAGTIGIFVGCEYVNAQGQVIHSQYYPSGTTGVVKAYVVDDPNVVFQVQANGAVTQDDLGQNVQLAAAPSTSSGNVVTGVSNIAVSATTATTSTFPFRIVGFASTPGDAATDLYVKFNLGAHSYTNATGI